MADNTDIISKRTHASAKMPELECSVTGRKEQDITIKFSSFFEGSNVL